MAKVPGPKPRGSEIQATRVSKGLTRKVLAEQATLAYVTVYNLECGHQPRTTWETLVRIANVLSVPVTQLIEDEDVEPKPDRPKREVYPTRKPESPGPTPPPRPTKSPTRLAEDAA